MPKVILQLPRDLRERSIMKLSTISRQITTKLFAALLLLALLQVRGTSAQSPCIPSPLPTGPVPEMTVKIYNNSSESLYASLASALRVCQRHCP